MLNNFNSCDISKTFALITRQERDVIILINSKNSDNIIKLLKFFTNSKIIYLPQKQYEPYRVGNLSNTERAYERGQSLAEISKLKKCKIIVSDYENIFLKYPKNLEKLYIDFPNNYSREEILQKLVEFGFFRTSKISGLNEFSANGEIIDIQARNGAFRIVYEWEKISRLYQVDAISLEIEKHIDNFSIFANNEILFDRSTLCSRKELEFTYTKSEDYSESLLNLLNNPLIISDNLFEVFLSAYQNFIKECYETFLTTRNSEKCLGFNELFFTREQIDSWLHSYELYKDDLFNDLSLSLSGSSKNLSEDILISNFKNNLKLSQIIFFHDSHLSYIKKLLDSHNIIFNEINHFSKNQPGIISLVNLSFASGFIYNNCICYSSIEIFGKVVSKVKKSKSKQIKDILIDINSFESDEYVIHSNYGIGIFKGCQLIKVLESEHECIKLEYFNKDIVYVPVENIDNITKYGNTDFVELDKLGTTAWQKKKAILKQRSFEYAQKLMHIAAQRALTKSYDFALNIDLFNGFLNKFPYIETEDQAQATNDILIDLDSSIFMDRLICGDVGYGKTEIAMRSAFAISRCNLLGNRLVVLVAPTTILCQQHFNSFKKRFIGFDVKIEMICRHTSKKKLKEIKEKIENQEIDIVIGTHSLFSDSINFPNLGLLIIDEEHNFGVKQKEKIKSSNPHIHILAMSATPIPRSLQMSLVGLRDLTIIATPPLGRKNVEIDIIDIDFQKIREILLKKTSSGGVTLFVTPRIEDIADITENLTKYVPELKYRIAHGKMDGAVIESVLEEFHHGGFDILVCTIILGSGIDIAIANNIIIYKADMFGLSQLYQLKGRVGRSNMESSAFLAVSKSSMLRAKTAQRIEVMKGLNHVGAGFAVASHDMDIRGFGNIIGDEQAGNIKHFGTELYKEMLEEAIEQIKGNKTVSTDISPTINLGLKVYIPENYIQGPDERLKIYRHIAEIITENENSEYMKKLTMKYGEIPEELRNLFSIVSIKNLCKFNSIKQIDTGPKGISISFLENHNVGDKIISFIKKYPRHTKLKGDNKLIYLIPIQKETVIQTIISIIEELRYIN
jgi:transcription-repair coupling factor (superfamily II helicase)